MKLFKKEDGTINTSKACIFSFVITCTILGLISMPMFLQDKAVETRQSGNTTTTTQVDGLLLCKECNIEFYNKEINLEFGENIKIKDILDIKDVPIANIKFTLDSEYLEKKKTDNEYYITTTNSVGETTIRAEYDKYSTTLKVNITASSLKEASFAKDVYYINTTDATELELVTLPKKIDLKYIKFTSSDESIAKFGNNNSIKGIQAGKTTVKLVSDSIEDTATVYVMNTPFTLKLKDDGHYEEMEEYTYKSNNPTQNLYIALKMEGNSNYTESDVSVKDESKGSISTTTTFDSIYSADNMSLIYKVVLTYDPTLSGEENVSVITFTLPDNSEKYIKIVR